jgi:dihydroxy-acid dehydratase
LSWNSPSTRSRKPASARPRALDRNLSYLGLVELLYGYPLDGVVLTIGCDKTTPAMLMAAATVNIPAIALSGGPMLNGWHKGERTGSGTIVWKAPQMLAAGEIDDAEFIDAGGQLGALDRLLQHDGHGHDDELAVRGPGHVAARLGGDPGARIATGRRSPTDRQAHRRDGPEDLKPSDILTRDAFLNAIRRQLGDRRLDQRADPPERPRAPHRRRAVDRRLADRPAAGAAAGQPAAGRRISRRGLLPRRRRAGGGRSADEQGLIHEDATDRQRPDHGRAIRGAVIEDENVIRPFDAAAGRRTRASWCCRGNLFDSAIMKTSVISEGVPRALSVKPRRPNAFEGDAVVFDGPEDYHHRIDDPAPGSPPTRSCSCAARVRSAIPARPRS